MNTELSPLDAATHPDGFIHFYKLLELEPGASDKEASEKINALYQEAQINRDHRVAARRREYQSLLEILPQARTVLLDEARRKRYNAYLKAVEMDLPRMTFPEFYEGLLRERGGAKEQMDILAIRDLSRLRSASGAAPEAPFRESEPKKMAVATSETPPTLPAAPEPKIEAAISHATSPAPETAPLDHLKAPANPIFSPQALVGALVVFGGLLATLPTMALVPLPISGALSLLCAGVTAYVFAQAGEPLEA